MFEAVTRGTAPWSPDLRRSVKLMADFPGEDHDWFAPRVNYEADEVAELVAMAHGHGVRVMAHVSGPVVGALVRAGVDSLEHAPLVDEPLLEEMVARGTLWCPTLATIERRVGPAAAATIRWRETLPRAVALGVPVLAGSDELGPRRGVATECAALVRAGGLTPAQALAAATTVPRAALGLPVVPGDSATFDGDPAVDITALGRVLALEVAAR